MNLTHTSLAAIAFIGLALAGCQTQAPAPTKPVSPIESPDAKAILKKRCSCSC